MTSEEPETVRGTSARKYLTLEQRVEAIRRYDKKPICSALAKHFKCPLGEIKNIVRDREAILETYEMKRRNTRQPSCVSKSVY